MASRPGRIVLIRHAETEWTLDGRHTGRTDIPLTERGRDAARQLAPRLRDWSFELVLVSPLLRARETCELCGLGERAEHTSDLLEWDYGDYEGLTSAQIHEQRPGWNLWRDGCPGGESAADVGLRADAAIARLAGIEGDAAVFSHGHMLRVLGARWIELAPAAGANLGLSPAAVCVLDHEHGAPILGLWNYL
jgi:broad specificity phosphatase PhoE